METVSKPLNRGELPYFLSQRYALHSLNVGRIQFTAAFLKQENDFKPAQFLKHMRQVSFIDKDEICVVARSLPTYVRKRLIEKGIAFVIPKVQMYLPILGMDLRSRARKKKPVSVESFSPATQVVLIHWLLGRFKDAANTPLGLSKQLSYSAMSVSRAFDELQSSEIAHVELSGRKRFATFLEDRKTVWQKALPYLSNPISRIVHIRDNGRNRQNMLPAGVTGLSVWSMLNKPNYPEYAMSRDSFKKMAEERVLEEDPGSCVLQIWRYNPKILKVDGQVDPFSLYLSFENETDERVDLALEEMLGRFL